MGDKEVVTTVSLLYLEYPSCDIVGPYLFTRTTWARKRLGSKNLGQAYDQIYQVMYKMNNYDNRPSALTLLESIPEKIPSAVLRATSLTPKRTLSQEHFQWMV